MSKTKISSKGQTVIPQELREQYQLHEGSQIEWLPWGAEALLVRKVSTKKPSWQEWLADLDDPHPELWKKVDPVRYVRGLRRDRS